MIRTTVTIEIKYTFNGSDLAAERESLGISQGKLAMITGIQQQNIAAYERPGMVTIREHTKQIFEKAGILFTSKSEVTNYTERR